MQRYKNLVNNKVPKGQVKAHRVGTFLHTTMVRPHKNTWIFKDTLEDRAIMGGLFGYTFTSLLIQGLRDNIGLELVRIKWGDGKIIMHRRLNDIKVTITHYE